MKKSRLLQLILMFLFSFLTVNSSVAKDLYVSTTGNDSVTYANNNISNPWATPEKAWYNAQTGDTVLFRGGTYTINTTINTADDGYHGTEENPITFKSYSGEQAIFNATCTPAFEIQKDYNYIENITCNGQGTFWEMAENGNGSYFKIQNCIGSQAIPGGAKNFGWVRFRPGGHYGIVENCKVEGPGPELNQNTAAVFCFRTQGVKILNNEFYNYPRGIYFKHTCVGYDTGIEIKNNYIHDCGTNGLYTVSQYADIENNLFVNASVEINDGGGGLGDDGLNGGGDYNNVEHNTIYNGTLTLRYENSGDGNGPQNNILKNNIITEQLRILPWNTCDHQTIMDYNLYCSGNVVYANRINYTLPEWQTFYDQDLHSLSGSCSFIGGASPSSTITDYALSAGSIGKNAASDGIDMGIDPYTVGLFSGAGAGSDPLEPPTGLETILK